MAPENREKTGRFEKGKSGNPGGRPKIDEETKEILKAASPYVAKKLVKLTHSKIEKIALQACTVVLDRLYGKPTQPQEVQLNGVLDIRSQVRAILLERTNGRSEQT